MIERTGVRRTDSRYVLGNCIIYPDIFCGHVLGQILGFFFGGGIKKENVIKYVHVQVERADGQS